MKQFFTVLSLIFIANVGFAQDQDPKAKAILDKLSKTTKTYKAISADFALSMYNKANKLTDKQNGKIAVKGDMFRLEIPGNVIVCNGKTLWNHNKDAKEVTIKDFDASNEDQINPSKIFTIYENGFKYKYEKEEKVGANLCQVINLYPSEGQNKKKYHTLKLYIIKSKNQVTRMKIINKDGTYSVYDIKNFKPNPPLTDDSFNFDTKGFKADEIIDERD